MAGSFHYFRALRDSWRDRLEVMKSAGLTVIDTYVEWATHNPQPGIYNWDDVADLEHFLELTQELGFYVILRPGPYINAARENVRRSLFLVTLFISFTYHLLVSLPLFHFLFFPPLTFTFAQNGLPYWLFTKYPGIQVRTSDKNFLNEVQIWYGKLFERVQKYLLGRNDSGHVIMVQVEDGYGSADQQAVSCDKQYLNWLRDETLKYVQEDALLFTMDQPNEKALACGRIENVFVTTSFDTEGGEFV